jgi:hypothetical protein
MPISWIYSISTQFPQGSLGRQISWLTMLAIALPPVTLVRFLRDGAKRSDVDEYETVPLTETGPNDGWGESAVWRDTDLAGDGARKVGKMAEEVHEAV